MTNFEPSWQKELSNSFKDPEKLLNFLKISPKKYADGFSARKLFPLLVPRPYAERIEKSNIDDPLLKQVLTVVQEFEQADGFDLDPVGEHESVIPGLLHKYQSRVLLIVKGGCAINCRYCFRRHFPYQDNVLNRQSLTQVSEYLANETAINEVILSGGDPLMGSDKHLTELVRLIESVPHISRIRIHTRLPVVIPQRITEQLVELFTNTHLKVVLVTHINHANEIDEFFTQQLAKLNTHNVTLLNQAVLLQGINDNLDAQVNLSERLFSVGILPYYLHMLDKVSGASHFDVSEDKAKRLYQQMLANLPGFLMPKWAKEEAGKASKTPINFIE